MKKLLIAALAVLALAASAGALVPLTYVATSTAAAPGWNQPVWAFQNTSAGLDVEVLKIEVSNAHDQSAIAGGVMQFQVFGSTALTHGGTGQTRSYSLTSANAAQPSYISFSTGPLSISYENVSGGLAVTSAIPLVRPLHVNVDESATSQLSDSYVAAPTADNVLSAPIKLGAGVNRALVIVQGSIGSANIQTGKIKLDVTYRVK